MTKRVQFVGHSGGAADSFQGRQREVTVDLDTMSLRVHDGILIGGFRIPNVNYIDAQDQNLQSQITANVSNITNAQSTADQALATAQQITADAVQKSSFTGEGQIIAGSGASTFSVVPIGVNSIVGRTATGNVDGLTPAEATAVLGLVIGQDVLAFNQDVQSIADATWTNPSFPKYGANGFEPRTAEQMRTDLDVQASSDIAKYAFPTGTRMLFAQATAPTSWTQDTTTNDVLLRLVSGNGGGSGGNWTISGAAVLGHQLTIAEMPSHTHIQEGDSTDDATGDGAGPRFMRSGVTKASQATGGDQAHSHGISFDGSWRPAYTDVILCVKD